RLPVIGRRRYIGYKDPAENNFGITQVSSPFSVINGITDIPGRDYAGNTPAANIFHGSGEVVFCIVAENRSEITGIRQNRIRVTAPEGCIVYLERPDGFLVSVLVVDIAFLKQIPVDIWC